MPENPPTFNKDYNLQTFHVVLVLFALIVLLLHADGNEMINKIFNRNNKWTTWIVVIVAGAIMLFHAYSGLTKNFNSKRKYINLWHVIITASIIAVTVKYHDQAYNLAAAFTSMALASHVFLVMYKSNQKNIKAI